MNVEIRRRMVLSLCLSLVSVFAGACTTTKPPSSAAQETKAAELHSRPVEGPIIGTATIVGAVNSPGKYHFRDARAFRFLTLVYMAGGVKDEAADDYVITRTDSDGKRAVLRRKARWAMGGPSPENVALQDGDEVYILMRGAPDAEPLRSPLGAQVVRNQNIRPAILSEGSARDAKMGLNGIDSKWSEYGAYLQKMIDGIQFQWERIILNLSRMPASGVTVAVKFVLNSEGKIASVLSVGGTANEAATRACVSAITERAPYGAWTPSMKAALGDQQEMTFTFYYQ